jgi:formate C-acetyltransferase
MGGCKYNYIGAIGTGLGTAADCMTALEKAVFQDHVCTLRELTEALADNWEGHENLRAICVKAPKYGTDNDTADSWAKFIADTFMDAYETHPTMRGGRYQCGFFSVTQNYVLGEDTDATPDGRYAKEMLSDSVSPSQYAEHIGPTATHRSFVKAIDTNRTINGITFAQSMDLNSLLSERELNKWGDLIRTFINDGGQSVQYNVLSLEELKDARKHPERHKDLFIRIGGYTARFVDLSEVMQEAVVNKAIQRC